MSEQAEFIYLLSATKPGEANAGEMLSSERPDTTLPGNAITARAEAEVMYRDMLEVLEKNCPGKDWKLQLVRFRRCDVVMEKCSQVKDQMEVKE